MTTADQRLTRSLLPAAVLFLLFALVLPGTSHAYSAKGDHFTDSVQSADEPQAGGPGGSDGDDPDASLAASGDTIRLPASVATYSCIPATAPEAPHTLSQARAPPASSLRQLYRPTQH